VYTPGSTLSTDARRLFKGFSAIQMSSMAGNSSYNSFQAGVQKRMAQGFTVEANYTYSKALENNVGGIVGPTGSTVLPWYFSDASALDRGPSLFDRRQRLVVSYLAQIPIPHFQNKIVRAVIGSWQTNGVFQIQSGDQFTVTAGKDQSMTGLGNDRAFLTGPALGGSPCGASAPCVPYLNTSSFALPATGTFGNVGQGAIRGPKMVTWDVSLFRDMRFRERFNVQLRGEFFNVLNHTNFADPVSSISSPGFGFINTANDPRIGQLALKFLF
jgi:hypothetical protein